MSQRNAPRRSSIAHLVIVAVLGLALVGLTQCRNVADSLTGTQVSHGTLGSHADCIHACNDQFKAGQKAEQATHKANVGACGGDEACQAREELRHEAAMNTLTASKSVCKQGCYNEGSGSGGS